MGNKMSTNKEEIILCKNCGHDLKNHYSIYKENKSIRCDGCLECRPPERTYTIEDVQGALNYFNAHINAYENPNCFSSGSKESLEELKNWRIKLVIELNDDKNNGLKKRTIV